MEQKEILKEEECPASTGEAAALDQTMFSTMDAFVITGKVLLPGQAGFLLGWKLEMPIESLG